jgi:hypothetical protein
MYTSKTGTGWRRLTPKQRQRLLAKFHHSQLTLREFATQNAIGMSTRMGQSERKSGCSGSLNQLASDRIRETQHVPHTLHLNYRDFDWLIGLLRLRDVPNGAFA